jgi:hypothetical protein
MVIQRYSRCSAFDGYRKMSSDWSAVRCIWCGKTWRTKAKYVATKPDAPTGWMNMSDQEIREALKGRTV